MFCMAFCPFMLCHCVLEMVQTQTKRRSGSDSQLIIWFVNAMLYLLACHLYMVFSYSMVAKMLKFWYIFHRIANINYEFEICSSLHTIYITDHFWKRCDVDKGQSDCPTIYETTTTFISYQKIYFKKSSVPIFMMCVLYQII